MKLCAIAPVLLLIVQSCAEYQDFNLKSFLESFYNPRLKQSLLSRGSRDLEDQSVCDLDGASFEIVENVKLNAPHCLLKELPYVNSIHECLTNCQLEPLCHSLELTEGVCRLYSISYDDRPDLFEASNIKGLHVVAQRRCSKAYCSTQWQSEAVPYTKVIGHGIETVQNVSRSECVDLCLREPTCRSVNYALPSKTCELNNASRQTLNSLQNFTYDAETIYVENNCVLEPSQVCTYEKYENLIPFSFDAFYLDARSEDECKAKCTSDQQSCRSYTFGFFANIPMCFITHQTNNELSREDNFCTLGNVTTNELKSCYNFETECLSDGLSVKFESSRDFSGAVYQAQSQDCRIEVQNNNNFYFVIPYEDPLCKVQVGSSGFYEVELQVQHYRPYVTSPDFIFTATYPCTAPPTSTPTPYVETPTPPSATETPPPPQTCPPPVTPEPIYIQQSCPPAVCPACKPQGPPQLGITVLHRNGTHIDQDPNIGDPVALAFFVSDIDTPFEPRITDVAAVNVNDSSVFQMIDKRGCPSKPYIAGKIYKFAQGLYMSDFEAFTFNQIDTVSIRYRAAVEWCWKKCAPPICDEVYADQPQPNEKEMIFKDNFVFE